MSLDNMSYHQTKSLGKIRRQLNCRKDKVNKSREARIRFSVSSKLGGTERRMSVNEETKKFDRIPYTRLEMIADPLGQLTVLGNRR